MSPVTYMAYAGISQFLVISLLSKNNDVLNDVVEADNANLSLRLLTLRT